MDQPSTNILEHIHAAYYHLPAAERRAADFVLANHEQVQFMSITQLAEECGVAEATVSRFCRRLKLQGFNAFKIELAKTSVSAPAQEPREQSPDTFQGRCAQVGRLSTEAVRQTLELVEPRQTQRAVELLEQATRVLCMGAGGSMVLATECATLFSTVSGKFFAVADSHNQMTAVATMGPQEAIVLFSYSGATTSGIQVLELAKSRGVPTVLITRFNRSPAARLADVVLRCGSNEGPFQFGSVPAKVAQLIVVDVLFQEFCYRNQEQSRENIQRIAAALSEKHV